MCYGIASHPENEYVAIQDTVHIGNKLRNRTLNEDLQMGSAKVTVTHLDSLVKNMQKSVHGLSQTEIRPMDRMNFTSFEKIIKKRVLDALKENIPNSEGTVKYLELCSKVTSCFLETDLKPLERISRMWYAVFILRIWRQFILSSKYDLQNSFISSNAYTCIEINARNLIV